MSQSQHTLLEVLQDPHRRLNVDTINQFQI